MIDSYARLKVNYGTEQKYDQPIEHAQQYVEIPSSWLPGARPGHGTYRTVKRTVEAVGTIEVTHYGTKRVEYGKVSHGGMKVLVVHDSTSWSAIDKKEK